MTDQNVLLQARVHSLQAALTVEQAKVLRLEAALRQRSLQLEALDGNPDINRQAAPAPLAQPPFHDATTDPEVAVTTLRPYLDSAYYLQEYPDVASSGRDVVLHYVLHGEAEGRRPRADFDPIHYRIIHPELARFEGNLFLYAMSRDRHDPQDPIRGE